MSTDCDYINLGFQIFVAKEVICRFLWVPYCCHSEVGSDCSFKTSVRVHLTFRRRPFERLVLCGQGVVGCGSFGTQRILKTECSKFLVMT
jgi:hypothetical protein